MKTLKFCAANVTIKKVKDNNLTGETFCNLISGKGLTITKTQVTARTVMRI